MNTGRLEAFSDGVIAIIITIMVLEMSVPREPDFSALRPMLPVFLSYVLSFIYLGIYWNNHHHMLHVTKQVSGSVLWANLHLLFWLSLIPFATGWMGQNSFAAVPTALYGVVLLMASLAWWILQWRILKQEGQDSVLSTAVRTTLKEKLSPVLYVAAIILAFAQPWIADALYAGVALMWLVPDRRIERALVEERNRDKNDQKAV